MLIYDVVVSGSAYEVDDADALKEFVLFNPAEAARVLLS
jgi:hypothetical protein